MLRWKQTKFVLNIVAECVIVQIGFDVIMTLTLQNTIRRFQFLWKSKDISILMNKKCWGPQQISAHTLTLLLVWKSPPGCAPLRILLMSRWNQTRWGCPGKKMSSVIFRTLSYNVFLTHFQVLGPKQITKQLNLCRPSGKESFLCTLSYTFLVRCCRKHFTKV